MTVTDKVSLIAKEHKQGLGSIAHLCKKHQCAISNFYRVRKKFVAAPVIKRAKRKYTRKPQVLDIPLQTMPEYVIICRADYATKVLGSL